MRPRAALALLPLAAGLAGAGPGEAPITLRPPIACALGSDCQIQSYPDDDPGPGVRDYMCHGQTYAAHDGTDFRVPSMARQRAGVGVVAAAAGTVLRVRDGVPDVSIRAAGAGSVQGQECGNGVVIGHPGGWETQYCHMRQGSIAVVPGQKLVAGAMLGQVGLSGQTEFPHVHLTVRKDGRAVDPFAYGAAPGACGGGRSLWAKTPAYAAGAVLVAGFASGPVTMAGVQDAGADQQPRPTRTTPLVAFVQAIGLQAGDVQRLVLAAPDGATLAQSPPAAPLERDKAQVLLFVGRKAPPGGWPAGTYRATYAVERAGRTVMSKSFALTL